MLHPQARMMAWIEPHAVIAVEPQNPEETT
jgi:hypothetical protein